MAYVGEYVGRYVGGWLGSIGAPPPGPPSPQTGPQQGGGEGGRRKRYPIVMAYTYKVGDTDYLDRAEYRLLKSAQLVDSLAEQVKQKSAIALPTVGDDELVDSAVGGSGIGDDVAARAHGPTESLVPGGLPAFPAIAIRPVAKQRALEDRLKSETAAATAAQQAFMANLDAIARAAAQEMDQEMEEEDDIIAALY